MIFYQKSEIKKQNDLCLEEVKLLKTSVIFVK
jgi:hypothetical protein